MTDRLSIRPRGPLAARIRPPGSKSITNRALVCAALAKGRSRLLGALDSEDTRVMREALTSLGFSVTADEAACRLDIIGGAGRIPAQGADLYVANSGTTARFLAPLVSLGQGRFRLDGTPRMRERPIADLLDCLSCLGVAAGSELATGCPPVWIEAKGLAGGAAKIRGDVSSQFLSGVLLAAPRAAREVTLTVEGPLVSRPYVDMTISVMAEFGVRVENRDPRVFHVPAGQSYRAREYAVEPDASAASYFFAAAAITGGEVLVEGLSRRSLQGDVAFVDILARMGCQVWESPEGIHLRAGPLVGVDVGMNAISDTVQTLVAVALYAQGPTTIRDVAHIRHKETDRVRALAVEARKLGASVEERPDGLRVTPGVLRGAEIATYQDHRMAMALSLVGLATPGVVILDPGCVAKTYPRFFDDLGRLG